MGVPAAILLLWLAFGATHVVLSSARVRPVLVARLGDGGFLALYSVVALAIFVPLTSVFATHKHAGPLLWQTVGPAAVARGLNHVLMAAALVLLVASLLPGSPPPSAMQARGPAVVRGMTRVTRHPTSTAFALFGLAHLLVNGNLGDLLFFGGFPVFSWVGARHQDSRKLRDVPGYADVVATTSIVPFAAIVGGRQRLADFPVGAAALGLALAVVLRLWHHQLFGP